MNDQLHQRTIAEPARSFDLRITEPNCGDQLFTPLLVATLRMLANHIERDALSVFDASIEPSKFSEMTGDVTTDVEVCRYKERAEGHTHLIDKPEVVPMRVQWACAETVYTVDADPASNLPHAECYHAPTADELASLTDAEREALGLVWQVEPVAPNAEINQKARGWLATNGEYACHVWFEGEPTTDQIGEHLTQTLRLSGIVAEHQQISIIFKEAA